MKRRDYKTMKQEELETKLIEIKKELMKEMTQVARGTTPKSPGSLRQLKKGIARIHALMTEKQRAAGSLKKE